MENDFGLAKKAHSRSSVTDEQGRKHLHCARLNILNNFRHSLMTKNEFISILRKAVDTFTPLVATNDGQWSIKGFIDIYKNIYTISTDTKVISKIIELYIFPLLYKFAQDNGLQLELTKEQNFYPDITFKDSDGNLFAVDIKSSYRKTSSRINGMTLGHLRDIFAIGRAPKM